MGLNKKSVDDINVKGLRVLCRCDFNVPLKDGKITEKEVDERVDELLQAALSLPKQSREKKKELEKQKEELSALLKDFPKEYTKSIFISAKERKQTDELQKMLINAAHLPTVTQNDIIVTNVRHYEALSKALDAIHRVQNGLDTHISGDFLSQDIRECIFFISDIAGEVTNDMVLQNIFQHFCVGK